MGKSMGNSLPHCHCLALPFAEPSTGADPRLRHPWHASGAPHTKSPACPPGSASCRTSALERPRSHTSSFSSESSGLVASSTTFPAVNGPSECANAAQAASLASALPGTASSTAPPAPAHSTAPPMLLPLAPGCALSVCFRLWLRAGSRLPYCTSHPAANSRLPRFEPILPAPMMAQRRGAIWWACELHVPVWRG